MTVRRDEVEADVDPRVVVLGDVAPDLELLLEVRLELGVDVVDDRLEAVLLVDLVAVADRVAEGELEI